MVPAAFLLALLAFADGSQTDASRPWGPEQALGAPDTPDAGDRPTAWASLTEDASDEWLELDYAVELAPAGVRVYESFHPGALRSILGVDAQGTEHVLWRGADPTPTSAKNGVSLIPLFGAPTIRRLRLELASSQVRGWNEIDAVGVHDASGLVHWAVSARASTTFASGSAGSDRAIEPAPPIALADLPASWASGADGLFEIYLRIAGAPGADAELVSDLAAEIAQIQIACPAVLSRGFGGRWKSTFGMLALTVEGERARGTYPLGELEGTVTDKRLDFTYVEGEVEGAGHFVLSSDEQSFDGRWHPEGSDQLRPWTGERLRDSDGASETWLVILESPWQSGLDEAEYSFGAMLRAIFEKSPGQPVRHRFFSDAEDFRRYCAEAALLPGKVVLVIAAHGGPEGVHGQGGRIDAARLAAALEGMQNLRTIHFSSCAVMAGDVAERITAALASSPVFEGVSGYATPVDWMASALTEFTYLELLLGRGLSAPAAAEQLLRILPFAGDAEIDGSPIPAAHFRFRGSQLAETVAAEGKRPAQD